MTSETAGLAARRHRQPRGARAAGVAALCSAALCSTALLAACARPPERVADLDADQREQLERMLAEEDRRPTTVAADELRAGLSSDVPLIREYAARGIGRLEDPAALPYLRPMLEDPVPAVRGQAAGAVAQSFFRGVSEDATRLLSERLEDETDAEVRGALARALGRLRQIDPTMVDATAATLIATTRDASIETLLPTLRGLEWLARTNEVAFDDDARTRLIELTRYGRRGAEGDEVVEDEAIPAARVRRLAMATLRDADALDADTVETALYDADVEVRRLAAAASGSVGDERQTRILIEIAIADAAGAVRYEALTWYARRLRLGQGCQPIVDAIGDDDPHVALLAIDLLAQGCRGVREADEEIGGGRRPDPEEVAEDPDVVALLRDIVSEAGEPPPAVPPGQGDDRAAEAETSEATPPDPGDDRSAAAEPEEPASPEQRDNRPAVADWHRPAHALVALARLDADATGDLIDAMAAHPTWQARMYAARAASISGSIEALEPLAGDADANVANAALAGLTEQPDVSVEELGLAALQRDDYQLLITAADALEATAHPDALPALAEALARITSQQRETSRDPRVAIIERIAELGGADHASLLRPYLRDFDPRVAGLAAETLRGWGVVDATADPQPLPPQPFPSIDDLLALQGSTAVVEMEGGGSFAIELHPFEAPTNVARFVRQANEGYFEGLTFHRVVPNFVVQGGSPGANEYMGDGPYSRDEVGIRSHLRGTVGISTRGRDTGDSQIFINLVDNVRLDHTYTIIGTVTRGMEVVDTMLEGATIARVSIQPGGANG